MANLPTQLEQVDETWLTDALSQQTPGIKVRSVEVESAIWGTATKVFLRVEYAHRPPGGPGNSLCLKGGFNDDMRQVAGLGYRIESRFYRDIGPAFGSSVPRCWYAEED